MDKERAKELLREITEVLEQNASWATAFNDAVRSEARLTGENDGLQHSSQLLYGGLNKADTVSFAQIMRDLGTAVDLKELTWDQAFNKGLGERDNLIRADEATKLEKLTSEREAEETRATERNGKKPAAKVAGRSGGGGLTRTQVKAMSAEDISKVSVEDLDNAMSK